MMKGLDPMIAGCIGGFALPPRAALLRAVMILAFLVWAAGCTSVEDPSVRMERALAHEAEGDLRAAAFELRRALQDEPDHPEIRFHLGRLNVLAGRGDAAERELRRALDLGIPAAQVAPWRVDGLLVQEQYTRALSEIVSFMEGDASAPDATWLARRAEAYLGLGRIAEAEADIRSASEADPGQPRVLVVQATMAQQQGHAERVLELARQAVQADGADPRAAVLQGWAALRLVRFEEAEQALRHAVEAATARSNIAELSRARLLLVEAYLGQGNTADAGATVEALEEIVGDVPEISYLKAVVAYRRGDFAESRTWLQDTLRQRPDHQPARLLSGGAAYAVGEYEEAVTHLRRHLAMVPDNAAARRLLAAAQSRLGRHEEAMAALEPLRTGAPDPDTATLLSLIGRAASVSGELDTAETALRGALAQAPGDASLRGELARLHAAQGRYDEAIEELSALVGEGDDTADLLLVRTLLAKGDAAAAYGHARSLVERDRSRPEWHALLGFVELARGDRESARGSLVDALDRDADYLPAVMALGHLSLEDGNLASAERYFNSALRVRPDHAFAMLGLAESAHRRGDVDTARSWLGRAAEHHPDAVVPRLWLARIHWQSGDGSAAMEAAREAVREAPGDARALGLLGELQLRTGDTDGASGTYKRLLEADPSAIQARLALARIEARRGREEEARRHMAAALESAPGDVRVIDQAGRLELALGQTDAALDHARRLQREHAGSPAGWILEGDVLSRTGRHSQAYDAYARAHAVAPASLTVRRMAGAAGQSGAGDRALQVLEDWLKMHPEDTDAMLSLAMLLHREGEHDRAEDLYAGVLERDPDQAAALNNLTWLYLERDDDRAMETARRAYELQPGPATAHTYGWTLVEHGDVAGGLPLIESAASQAPVPEVRYRLAVALSRSGDDVAARRVLSELLDEHERFRERAEALALYESLSAEAVP